MYILRLNIFNFPKLQKLKGDLNENNNFIIIRITDLRMW